MELEDEGMLLRFDTPDAPVVHGPRSTRVVVAVRPADASNVVDVEYRIGSEPVERVRARWVRNDPARDAQYFAAELPLRPADAGQFLPVCECAGRRVPRESDWARFAAAFAVPAGPGAGGPDAVRAGGNVHEVGPVGTTTAAQPPPSTAPMPPAAPPPASFAAEAPGPVRAGLPPLAELRLPGDSPTRQALLDRLAGRGIRSVEDLLSPAGAAALAQPAALPDGAALDRLRAHAALVPLTSDVLAAERIVEAGYRDVASIARTPRTEFLAALGDRIDPTLAAGVHAGSIAEATFTGSVLLGAAVDAANGAGGDGSDSAEAGDGGDGADSVSCGCRDCETAVSPLAYLANLMEYALQHLRLSGAPVNLDWLVRSFHQPLAELPADCSAVDEEVRPVRLGIEAVRSWLRTTRSPAPDEQRVLDEHVRRYCQRAYAALLGELGTSYGQLRAAAVSSDAATRTAYAERLGIDLTVDGQDTLTTLVLDISRSATGTGALSEASLEARFGLRDTTRQPLSTPPEPQLAHWRRQQLRRLWGEEDHPSDPYVDKHLPVIDPDLIWPRDMRARYTDGVRLWDERRAWVDARITALSGFRDPVSGAVDLAGMLAVMSKGLAYGTQTLVPWAPADAAQLPGLRAKLSDPAQRPAALDFLQHQLGLHEDAYLALTAVQDDVNAGKCIEVERFDDVAAILVQAQKRRFFPVWIAEEPQRDVAMDVRWFCISPDAPVLRRWLATAENREQWRTALRAASRPALIDPDLVGPADMHAAQAGQPEYDLWLQRRTAVDTYLRHLERSLPRTLGDLDAEVLERTGLSGDHLESLGAAREAGTSIAAALELYTITGAEVDQLVRARRQLQGTALFDDDWSTVFAIFVQLYKRRSATVWRNAERAAAVVAGPDAFMLPEPAALPFDAPAMAELLPAWRATVQDRQAWEDRLRRRTEDDQAVGEALQRVLATVEQETLPALRDALIEPAVAQAWSLERKRKWLSDVMLIDLSSGECQVTTRAAQAIETVQGLLTGVRTGQLRDTYQELTLVAADFDAEWRWIGSYATWRAAMFVFLYPDNVLLPSLRKEGLATPAFLSLVDQLRANASTLNPRSARTAARQYEAYLRDIASLRPEAACHVDGDVHLFARGGTTAGIYWARWDVESDGKSDAAQTYWQRIPAEAPPAAMRLIGAVAFTTEALETFLYLFAMIRNQGALQLAYTRYNLRQPQMGWPEFTPIDPPSGLRVDDALLAHGLGSPPTLVLRLSDGKIHPVRLTGAGTDLQGGDWDWNGPIAVQLRDELRAAVGTAAPELLSLVDTDYGYCLFCCTGGNGYVHFTGLGPGLIPGTLPLGKVDTWQGALTLDTPTTGPPPRPGGIGSDRVWAFWVDGITTYSQAFGVSLDGSQSVGYTRWSSFLRYDEVMIGQIGGQDIRETIGNGAKGVVYRRRIAGADRWGRGDICRPNGGDYITVGPWTPLAPRMESQYLFHLSDQVSGLELQQRASAVEGALADNADTPRSYRTYLEEALHFVPMHLAQQLQVLGHYDAALDWMRTVYDYTAQDGERRKIWFGLIEEETLPEVWQRAPDWLLDPLNPHVIARTRRNAYTRFAVTALARCMLDYAAAEFTRDTSESLPRARTLYETALDLLNRPELGNPNGTCSDLIGRLDIQVGSLQAAIELGRLRQDLSRVSNAATVRASVVAAQQLMSREAGETTEPELLASLRSLRTGLSPGTDHQATLASVLRPTRAAADPAGAALRANPMLAVATATVGALAARAHTRLAAVVAAGQTGTRPAWTDWLAWRNPSSLAGLNRIFSFCIPPNPVVGQLRLGARLDLYKLRNCRNIAGLERTVDTYAAPTDVTSGLPNIGAGGQIVLPGTMQIRPTPYRFSFLVQRARELVQLANQVESALLQALERRDFESYELLRARQNVMFARAQVRLQDLRVVEAQERRPARRHTTAACPAAGRPLDRAAGGRGKRHREGRPRLPPGRRDRAVCGGRWQPDRCRFVLYQRRRSAGEHDGGHGSRNSRDSQRRLLDRRRPRHPGEHAADHRQPGATAAGLGVPADDRAGGRDNRTAAGQTRRRPCADHRAGTRHRRPPGASGRGHRRVPDH